MTSVRRFSICLLIVALAGCTIRTGDLTLVATKNIPSVKQAQVRGQFEESDCKIFGIPNVKEAIDRTIEKGNGNALIDAALYQDIAFFQSCFRAKGTVVKLKPTEE